LARIEPTRHRLHWRRGGTRVKSTRESAALLEQVDQHLRGRRLARARPAADDRRLPLQRRIDGPPLVGLEHDFALGVGSSQRAVHLVRLENRLVGHELLGAVRVAPVDGCLVASSSPSGVDSAQASLDLAKRGA
jgi:hypothetical protein